MAGVTQTATLVGGPALTGSEKLVQVVYGGSTMPANIGAITQKIHYDPTKLTFINVTGVGTLAAGTNYSVNTGTGIITITWTNIGGTSIVWPANYFDIRFMYTGSSVTNVDFVAGCIISTTSPVTNVPITYNGTTVYPGPTTATAVLGSKTGALQGQDFEVPINLSGFPIGIAGGTQAFTLTIPFDSPRLSYLGLKNPVSGLIVSQASGTLTLAWSNPAGPNINNNPDPLIVLKFKYNGIGTANISFGNTCLFNTYNAGTVATVQVAYTNATVTPEGPPVVTANAIIGYKQATIGTNVNVPISFTGLPDMGAVTLFISYDYNKLTYINAQNNIFGASVQVNPTTHVISVAWSAASATNLNVPKFLDLQFTYNGGGIGCGAPVSFIDGCELSAFSPVAIVPANWSNGGVNLMFKVSGTLVYNSEPQTDIALVGFTVNLKTNPGDVTVGTATTDANGYYEIWTSNGDYYLEAVAPSGYAWYADFDDVLAMFDYTFGTPIPYQNALRIRAGDVNENGDIDFDDVLAVFDRTFGTSNPEYLAPDWVFEVPTFSISCADLPSQDFMGLNTGNVLGSNPTPNP
jgi:hypothetical protein